jgi:hypothetical protein
MSDPFDPKPDVPSYGVRVARQGGFDGEHEPPSGPEPTAAGMSRHASEWGLASLLCAGFVLVCLPAFAVFDLLYWLNGRQVVATASGWAMGIVYVGATIGAVVAVGLCVVSLAFGIRALLSASRHRQPRALAVAGTVVSAAALVVTTFLAVGSLMIILSFA